MQYADHRLDDLELFAPLPPSERALLAARLEPVTLRRGEVLVRQGDPADALFVVSTGRFAVRLDGRDGTLAEIGPGEPIGEIGFLAGGERTATVIALRDSLVLRLGRDGFESAVREAPSLWPSLAVSLARRLASANASTPAAGSKPPRTIAVIRAGAGALPHEFAPMFQAALERTARTRLIGPETARGFVPRGGSFDCPEVTAALNALEASAEAIIYVAEPDLTPWSEKAIRQADLVLAVGAHASDPAVNPLERRAAEFLASSARRLVLVHPARERVTGTSRWLADRDVAMHHHVALDGTADLDRLVRFVQGTALGLVACGGGAFCAAHTGVYAALREANLSLDMMGGTSAGSAFSAAFAMGLDPEEIVEATHDIFVTNRAMRRFTWPRYGLLDHQHFDRQLSCYFGGIDIEDLWVPFFAVSADLSSYEVHCHRRGDLWTAIRASASIPALLPPVYTRDGHMLVDGCLLDNVPVRVMHGAKSGPNIVICLEPPALESFDVDYAALPGRRGLLGAMLNPLGRALPNAPGPLTVLLRSLSANRQDFVRSMTATDLLLVPPVPAGMGFLDWHRHRELMETARAWATADLARLAIEGHPCLAGARPL